MKCSYIRRSPRPVASGGGVGHAPPPTKRFDALFCRIDLVNLVFFGNVIDISKIASSTVVSVIYTV